MFMKIGLAEDTTNCRCCSKRNTLEKNNNLHTLSFAKRADAVETTLTLCPDCLRKLRKLAYPIRS